MTTKPLTDHDGKVRDLSEDLRRFRPALEVLPVDLQETLGIASRAPQETPPGGEPEGMTG